MPDSLGTFIAPDYEGGCFSALPELVVHGLIGGPRPPLPAGAFRDLSPAPRMVVLFFVDAFGWHAFQRHREHPFLRRVLSGGQALKITSQFPSTTAAHVTCLHTGLPVGKSAVLEWNYYEPQVDAMISPLLFSFAGDRERGTLSRAGVRPEAILPTRTLYHRLARAGVPSHVFQPREHLASPFASTLFDGASVHGYATRTEALVDLGELLRKTDKPLYCAVYLESIDLMGHEHGPQGPHVDAQITSLLDGFQRLIPSGGGDGRILFLLVADHGMVETDPTRTVYLNRDPLLRQCLPLLRRSRTDRLLVPGGSCRDLFLYVRSGCGEEARQILDEGLAGRAQVRWVEDLIAEGYFGPEPVSPHLRERAGDLVILPYRSESVWWWEEGRFEYTKAGFHGGLTRLEMEIPLLIWRSGASVGPGGGH